LRNWRVFPSSENFFWLAFHVNIRNYLILWRNYMDARSSTLAMFPGQGSQYIGMGKMLLAEFPYTKSFFEEAEDTAKVSIRRLCLEGPEDQLKLTANTQPCIVTVSVATWRVLREEMNFKADYFAGHSLGEYAALVAAEKLDFTHAIRLVRQRGLAMQKAVPEGEGAMIAVLGSNAETLLGLCKQYSDPEHPAEIANYNSPQQLVVAGSAKAVAKLSTELKNQGIKHVPLPVSAPFHSSMMKPAKEEMRPLLDETKFLANEHRIIPNLTAEFTAAYNADFLIRQIDSPVKWTQTIDLCEKASVRRYVEVGPGKVLAGLAKRILPKGEYLIETTDDVLSFVKTFK
jgi:[acyl-carrier-protein] S-malonyltransferase